MKIYCTGYSSMISSSPQNSCLSILDHSNAILPSDGRMINTGYYTHRQDQASFSNTRQTVPTVSSRKWQLIPFQPSNVCVCVCVCNRSPSVQHWLSNLCYNRIESTHITYTHTLTWTDRNAILMCETEWSTFLREEKLLTDSSQII